MLSVLCSVLIVTVHCKLLIVHDSPLTAHGDSPLVSEQRTFGFYQIVLFVLGLQP